MLWNMVLDIAVSEAQIYGPIVGSFLMFGCWIFWACKFFLITVIQWLVLMWFLYEYDYL